MEFLLWQHKQFQLDAFGKIFFPSRKHISTFQKGQSLSYKSGGHCLLCNEPTKNIELNKNHIKRIKD